MANPFSTARLVYRAVEPSDSSLFEAIQTDAIGYQNANYRIAVPQSKKDAAEYQRYVAEEVLIGVVICLKPSPSPSTASTISTTSDDPATPVGVIHLGAEKLQNMHHRQNEIGLQILAAYQGKGYGSEAIGFVLRWGFRTMGLHRIQIRAFEYNEGARRLYERLGFKEEGRWREHVWFDGRWWDDFQYAMLDREWADMQEAEGKVVSLLGG